MPPVPARRPSTRISALDGLVRRRSWPVSAGRVAAAGAGAESGGGVRAVEAGEAAGLVNRVTAQPAPATSTTAATYASERRARRARVARATAGLAGGTASVGMSGSAGKGPVLIRGALFPRARSRRI